jgi:tagatose-6-phosphate ketose/aldose isomerase
MKYLGFSIQELTQKGGIHTAKEISQQPLLWQKIWDQVEIELPSIKAFLNEAGFKRIILTGAGTSAFIGLSLRGVFQRNTGIVTEAISTTDLVSHPKDYLQPAIPTLLISFARSGNSPESVAAVTLADEICVACYHLIITCNTDGLLAKHKTRREKYVFTLPPEANDQSLAMTSSYTGMLLAGKLIAHHGSFDGTRKSISVITKYANKAIAFYAEEIKQVAELNFKRAVFLGAGPFLGTATEGHLKLQELTDGKVICKNDSFLGFRHGPKAVIDETTLVVYLFSNNKYSLQYEKDLVGSMKKGKRPLAEIGISESAVDGVQLDHSFTFSENGFTVDEEFMTVCSIIPAQLLGFYKSLQLGLKPDAPSETGAITRVVEGVHIYSI